MTPHIIIEPTGANDTGVCDCCGRSSRRVWGRAHVNGKTLAAYFVHWTLGHVQDQGADIDLILGEWGETATAEQREAIALSYRLLDTGPAWMVIDANQRPISKSPLVGHARSRNEVVGTSVAQEGFTVADAVLRDDTRVAELLGGWKLTT